MKQFTLNARTFIAINKYAASSEETRYYLNGVCVEVRDGRGFMVATDGHKLLCAPFETNEEDCQHIIPRKLINNLKVNTKSESDLTLTINEDSVSINFDGVTVVGKAVDGTFPDWKRVIPREVSDEPVQFNNALLKDMDDAAKLVSGRKDSVAYVRQSGNNPALIGFDGEGMLGVVMPRLPKAQREVNIPSWL